MTSSMQRLRSIESIEEQFVELDRRMALGRETETRRPHYVDQPPTAATALRAVEETGKSPYLRLAVNERPVPRRP